MRLDSMQFQAAISMLQSECWSLPDLARYFGLSISEMQIALGLPQWIEIDGGVN